MKEGYDLDTEMRNYGIMTGNELDQVSLNKPKLFHSFILKANGAWGINTQSYYKSSCVQYYYNQVAGNVQITGMAIKKDSTVLNW